MAFHVATRRSLVDEVTDPNVVGRLRHEYAEFFEDNKNIREAMEDCAHVSNLRRVAGKTGEGTSMWVARIPSDVWRLWMAENPNLLQDKEDFYRRLRAHPGYRIGGFQLIG